MPYLVVPALSIQNDFEFFDVEQFNYMMPSVYHIMLLVLKQWFNIQKDPCSLGMLKKWVSSLTFHCTETAFYDRQ